VRLTMSDYRPWEAKWVLVKHCLDSLEAAYRDGTGVSSNLDVELLTTAFFVECDHLRDWLKGDLPPGVTESDIESQYWNYTPLERCNAICNSHKHYRRRQLNPSRPLPMTARIREVEVSPERKWSVTVLLDWATASAHPIDALDLARDCVASWRRIFASLNIVER